MRLRTAVGLAVWAGLVACGGDDGSNDDAGGILDQLTFDTTLLDFRGVPLKLEVVSAVQITNEGIETVEITDVVPDQRFSTSKYEFRRLTSLPVQIRPGPPTPLQFSFRASEPVTRLEATSEVTLVLSNQEELRLGLVAETDEALGVNTTSLDFGEVLVGRPSSLLLRVRNQLNRPVPVYAQTFGGRARPEMIEGIGRFEIDTAVNDDGRLVNAAPLGPTNTDGDSIDIEIRYLPDPSAVSRDRARWRIGACPELDDDCAIEIELTGEPIPSPIQCENDDGETVEEIAFGNLNPPEAGSVELRCIVRAQVRLTDLGVPLSGTGIEVTDDLIDRPPIQLDEEDEFTLTIDFDPSVLEPGTDIPDDTEVRLSMRDPANDAPFEPVEIELAGGHGRPVLEVSPDPVTFGTGVVGALRPERVTVTNQAPIPFSGEVRVEVGPNTEAGTFSSARSGGTIDLEPGASESFFVDFDPQLPVGPASGALIFETNETSDPRNPSFRLEVPLSGNAEDLGDCTVFLSTESIEFGRSVELTENRAYLALTNVDSGICLVDGVRLGPDTDPELSIVEPPGEVRLGPDESLLLELGYVTSRPFDAEDLDASGSLELYVSTVDEPSFRQIPISGQQSRIALVRGPNVVDLRAGDPTCRAYAKTVSLLNGDTAEVTVDSIRLTGDDALAFSLDLNREPPFALPARRGRETFRVVLDPSLADETLLSAQVEIDLSDSRQPFIIPVLARSETGSFFEESFVQGGLSETDVVFVLPSRAPPAGVTSILEEAAPTFSEFIDPILDAGLDYHVGFVTGFQESPVCGRGVADDPGRLEHAGSCGLLAAGPVGVEYREEWRVIDGSEVSPSESFVFESQMQKPQGFTTDAHFESAHLALHPGPVRGWNSEIHRPDALIHLVFASTRDDASAGTLDFYAEQLRYARGYPRRFDTTASAIVGPEDGPCTSPITGSAEAAPRFVELVRRVGGAIEQSVCTADWDDKMRQVGIAATGIRERVQLSRSANLSSMEVRVDGVVLPRFDGPEENWAFDSGSRVLTLRDPSALEDGAEITVTYRPVCSN